MQKELFSKDWLFTRIQLGPNMEYTPEKTDLPHDYMVSGRRDADSPNGARGAYYYSDRGVYEKYITVPENHGHMILDVDGAYMCTEVGVNLDLLAMHPHGYTPFLVDLTDALVPGKMNKLTIATNPPPASTRWYSGAGIYRDLFLWTGGSVRVEPRDIFITSEINGDTEAEVFVAYEISSDLNTAAGIKTTVFDEEGCKIAESNELFDAKSCEKIHLKVKIPVSHPHLWNPDNPYLYNMHTEISVTDEKGSRIVTDTSDTVFGIRNFTVTPGKGLFLNGKNIKLRGGCIHNDHGVLGAAAFPSAEERKLRILKEAGFNAVRIAHNPPSTALLEAADRLGMIVITEAFDTWNVGKTFFDYHMFFRDNWASDIECMVKGARNHPCVFAYSIGNEILERDGRSEGYCWARKLADEVRKYDTTRPVTEAFCGVWNYAKDYDPAEYIETALNGHNDIGAGDVNSSWYDRVEGCFKGLDIIGYNYLYDRYDTDCKNHPERVIWGSETHALTFYDGWAATMRNSNVIGDFIWTAYDNMGEAGAGQWKWARDGVQKGLSLGPYPWRTCFQGDLDLCGNRRPQSYFKETVWLGNTEPIIFTTHPKHFGEGFTGTGWHWHDVQNSWTFEDEYIGKPVKCEVYTDADEVEFILNGSVLGRAKSEKDIAYFDVIYEKGILEAITYKSGKMRGYSKVETVGEAAQITVKPEKESVCADGRDLCYFDITVADASGRRLPYADNELKACVAGGEFMGIFSANPVSEDVFTSDSCHAFEGRALLIVRARNSGTVKVSVSCPGLKEGTAEISAI